MRVNEIFYSLQGEGHFTGTPAIFVRLSGCNQRCPFCDTRHEGYTEMNEEEIVAEALRLYPHTAPSAFSAQDGVKARHIVITGGEPTLQLNAVLTRLLHDNGFFIQIESNGSVMMKEGVEVDWVTCSPKEMPVIIQRVDELKVLFMRQDMAQYNSIAAQERRLQPLDSGNAVENADNLRDTINYILDNPQWKLSLQTHKILNVR